MEPPTSTPTSPGPRNGPNPDEAMTLSSMINAQPKAPIVVALGGNALLKRGEPMTMDNQRRNIAQGMEVLARAVMAPKQTSNIQQQQQRQSPPTVIVHGNGPQVGLLMLESAAYEKSTGLPQQPLDVLDAETEGMIGYMIEQELHRHLYDEKNSNSTIGMATVLSQIVCDPTDPAFDDPTKFVGPVYTKEESEQLGLPVKPDGNLGHYRRVVPSPQPVRMIESQLQAVRTLIENDCIVICAGGGGIPVVKDTDQPGHYRGIDAVIDKDCAAAMVGSELEAQGLLILTDVSSVNVNHGRDDQRSIRHASPKALKTLLALGHFPPGSMGPKVESAIKFVTGAETSQKATVRRWAAIGALKEVDRIMAGQTGTVIIMPDSDREDWIQFY